MTADARIPIVFGDPTSARLPGDATLTLPQADAAHAPGHTPGCACCAPRLPTGRALAALLHDRARGRVAFFTRVVVAGAARAEVEAALAADPVAGACFRLADQPPG